MQSYEKKEFFPIEKSGTLRGKLYLCCFKKRNNMENQKLYDLRDEFLRTWPLERVKGMSIEEYTNLNKKDSFCYWLEAITQDLGSIWGGSAFKFGIYKRKDTKREFEENALSDGEYAWLAKYGKTKDEAFDKVKSIIVDIIEKSKARDFKAIEPIDLGNATKWKIAHLYSDNHILNVFSKEKLKEIAKRLGVEFDKKISFYDLQDLVLKQKSPEEDYFTFAANLWDLIDSNETHYWLYSPGEQAVMWGEFYDEGIMALGWDELEDLENYTDRKSILEALIDNYGGGEDQRNNVSAIDDFCHGENKINIGDIVIVKKGTKTLLGYGRVTSDYYYDENREEFLHCREVKWFKKGEWNLDFTLPRKTLTDVTTYNSDIEGIKYAQYLLNIMNENTQDQENNLVIKLLKYKPQIILQGPPGTGKTREAKRIAKALLGLGENDSLEGNEQFKLIQFHPSYSYEDFVRGIVAKPNEEGDGIVYTAENKVLAEFAKEALNNWSKTQQNTQAQKEQGVFEAFIEHINEELAQNEDYKYPLTESVYIFDADDKRFKYKGDNWEAHRKGLNMNYIDIKRIIESGIKDRQGITKLTNIGGLARQHASYFLRIIEKYYEFRKNYNPIIDKIPLKSFVLIIDEINRANLSAVLGELIYALEYRGEAVQSMYTIEGENNLILPPNLYIIGTMNTADRSVGHIDYAIRRRFAFVNVLPKDLTSELGDQFESVLFAKVTDLFNTNLSPEFKKEDVQLGHSYFITKNTPIDIRWEYEIKPILLEYIKDGILIGQDIEEKINSLITV
ncbi:AAA family ATPase [Capnocytophaga gingivalis]|uniref:McrB family protein n=1 Tax=Capnocytophaga gingivalis TaxID=1017 RepID=UPI0028EB03F2|nr:AAA family ATPase [Capnocytophaga gingivalis]